MGSDGTPTTEEVRECYRQSGDGLDFKRAFAARGEAFDRWLAQVRAATWDEGFDKGFYVDLPNKRERDASEANVPNPYEASNG